VIVGSALATRPPREPAIDAPTEPRREITEGTAGG